MGSMPFAFSVHNFISSVGADAGFAAIIGLAILVLLYFAHARETANLREEAALLAARLQQAEARVAELSRPQPVAVPAAEAVQVTDQRSGALGPFAPAGTAAPALAAATRVVPLAVPSGPDTSDPEPAQPAVAVAAVPVAAASSVAPAARPPASVSVQPPVPAAPSTSPAASSPGAAPAAPPVPRSPAPPPPGVPGMPGPATAAAANGAGQGPPRSLPAGSPPSRTSTATIGARPLPELPPLGSPGSSGRSPARRIVLATVALLLVAAAVIALVVITGSGGSSSPTVHPRTTNAPTSKQASAFSPSAVTVAVLNGTSTNQLAHHVAAKLAGEGYKEGRIATAANQTLTATNVAYLPGAKNRTDALHVAKALNLRSTAVHPIDPGTQQVACPPPGACGANVVVTVGADLATL